MAFITGLLGGLVGSLVGNHSHVVGDSGHGGKSADCGLGGKAASPGMDGKAPSGGSAALHALGFNGMLADESSMSDELLRVNGAETLKTQKSNEQDLMISEQSSRAIGRAAILSMTTSKHEGLMQSIQTEENTHIKSSFDLVKQA